MAFLLVLVGVDVGLFLAIMSLRDWPARPHAPMTDDERLHCEDPATWEQLQG